MGNTVDLNLITKDGRKSSINIAGNPLGGGADANIFQIAGQPDTVAKIYHDTAKDPRRPDKIRAMLANPPHMPPIWEGRTPYIQIAWPTATIEDSRGHFAGYAMPLVDLKGSTVLENLLAGKTRRVLKLPEFYGYRVVAAANLAAVVDALHACNHHIIDLKPVNLNVYTDKFYIALLDCDGLSIAGDRGKRFLAHQYTDGYIAPEALQKKMRPQDLGENQDRFALAVTLFQLFNCGIHPYQGVPLKGTKVPSTNSERIRHNLYAYGLKANKRLGPTPWSIHEFLEDDTRYLFDRAFGTNVNQRPCAAEWKHHLQTLVDPNTGLMQKCRRNARHGMFTKGCGFCHVDGVKQQAKHVNKARRPARRRGIQPPPVRRTYGTGRTAPSVAPISLSLRAKLSIAGGFIACILIAVMVFWYADRDNIHRVIARNDQQTFFERFSRSEIDLTYLNIDDARNAMVYEDERMFCAIIENMPIYVPYGEDIFEYLVRERHVKSLATYIKHLTYPGGMPHTYDFFHQVMGTGSPDVIETYRQKIHDEYVFPREELYAEIFLRQNITEIKEILRWGVNPNMDIFVNYHQSMNKQGRFQTPQDNRAFDYRYHIAEKLHAVRHRVPNFGYCADTPVDAAAVSFLCQRYDNTFKIPGVSRIRDIELTAENFKYVKKRQPKTRQGPDSRQTPGLEYKVRPLTITVLDNNLELTRVLLAAGAKIPSRIPDHASIFKLAPNREIYRMLKTHHTPSDAVPQALIADDPEKLAAAFENNKDKKNLFYQRKLLIDALEYGSLRCFDFLNRSWPGPHGMKPLVSLRRAYESGNPLLLAYYLIHVVPYDTSYTYEQIKKGTGSIYSGMKKRHGIYAEYDVLIILNENRHYRTKIGDLFLQMAIEDKAWAMAFVIDDIGAQWTDLHLAVLAEDKAQINHLLQIDPGRIEERDARGRTPLALAAQYQCGKSFSVLMNFKPDLNAVENIGFTPILHAISYGSVPMIQKLLENGASLNQTFDHEWGPALQMSSSIKAMADEILQQEINGVPDAVIHYCQEINLAHTLVDKAARKVDIPTTK